MTSNILTLIIVAAFVTAPIVYLLGRSMGKKVSWLVLAVFVGDDYRIG